MRITSLDEYALTRARAYRARAASGAEIGEKVGGNGRESNPQNPCRHELAAF